MALLHPETVARIRRNGQLQVGAAMVLVLAVVAIFGPHLLQADPLAVDFGQALIPPGLDHWFGTDDLGRDVFARVVAAAVYDDNQLTPKDLPRMVEYKRNLLRSAGCLEAIAVNVSVDEIGGLDNLKVWLTKRRGATTARAREYGLDAERIIKLASNENPLGMPASARQAMLAAAGELGRYPEIARSPL